MAVTACHQGPGEPALMAGAETGESTRPPLLALSREARPGCHSRSRAALWGHVTAIWPPEGEQKPLAPQRAPAIRGQSPDPGEVGAPAGWSPAPPTACGLTGPTGGHPRHRASPVSNRGHGSRKWSPKLCSTEHPGHCSERLLDRRTLGALSGLRHSHWVHRAHIQWA